ncbi:MAG: hypothetical protein V5A22_04625 [Salinivenus sp.]
MTVIRNKKPPPMSDRAYKIMFLVAAWHNFIGGTFFALFGNWVYRYGGINPPSPGIHYKTWVGLIFVFGVMYYMIYEDMYANKNLVIVGIVGKFVSSLPMVYGLLFYPESTPGLFIVPIFTDMSFGVLFFLFYAHARRSKGWKRAR